MKHILKPTTARTMKSQKMIKRTDNKVEPSTVQEQHRAWAKTLCESRSVDQKREASNGIYKAFYHPLIYYFMRKLGVGTQLVELQDLTMSTLEKAFSKIKQYNPDNAAFSTWVYRIALNTLIDLKRMSKDIDVMSVEAINAHNVYTMGEADAEQFELVSSEQGPAQVAERNETHAQVRAAINGLRNPSERRVVELRFLEEYSYEEIAEALEMPMGTVKAMLFRAKSNLQIVLSKKLEMA